MSYPSKAKIVKCAGCRTILLYLL
ncbi:hypothetical protein FFE93_020955 [Yersinia sp. KBS0713]|nr:hypothetical protein [Yersinia bercovieri]QDW35659.1 hypothetical protein FFE93_020955 [Yersinia sp. KBS0713]QKJ08985.1 hypothetical protein HRK25_06450 [Yersinia bercovieri ATCC 43970]